MAVHRTPDEIDAYLGAPDGDETQTGPGTASMNERDRMGNGVQAPPGPGNIVGTACKDPSLRFTKTGNGKSTKPGTTLWDLIDPAFAASAMASLYGTDAQEEIMQMADACREAGRNQDSAFWQAALDAFDDVLLNDTPSDSPQTQVRNDGISR